MCVLVVALDSIKQMMSPVYLRIYGNVPLQVEPILVPHVTRDTTWIMESAILVLRLDVFSVLMLPIRMSVPHVSLDSTMKQTSSVNHILSVIVWVPQMGVSVKILMLVPIVSLNSTWIPITTANPSKSPIVTRLIPQGPLVQNVP
jgi:hypothetical protein